MLRVASFTVLLLGLAVLAADRPAHPASKYRKPGQAVLPMNETTIVAEGEEFQPAGAGGWEAKPWEEAYYAATLANTFHSRKAFLSAPGQCDDATATITVQVPKAGKYLALVRYEAAYRFETQFTLKVEQGGATKLTRLYGARKNPKIWAFREKIKPEVMWPWGAGESVVWEGHDAAVQLDAGPAKLTLIAGKQPTPAARRNVDLVLLTSDEADIKNRIEKENYLPLDGLLTQAGDLHVNVHNKGGGPLTLTLNHGIEHSPYWVHLRAWKPKTLTVAAGASTGWEEVGSLLDSLNDGQWAIKAKGDSPRFDLDFGVRDPDGKITQIRRFADQTGDLELAYEADTRYSRQIRLTEDVLYDLVAYLKAQPIRGQAPKRTLIYGYTFTHRDGNAKYNAAVDEFIRLTGGTGLAVGSRNEIPSSGGLIRGYTDLRGQNPEQLKKTCEKLKAEGKADKIAVVSLGDEIGLPAPPATDHAGFRAWVKAQGLKPAELDPATGGDLEKLQYSPTAETAKSKPGLFYYSQNYKHRYGIGRLKQLTDVLKQYLPNAGIGANFSPHHANFYLGPTYHWISVFREDGMTMPWGEDYIFQVPVGTQQMNFLMPDMYRASIKDKPGAKIHYYVMPHWPGNTPASWRRQFYGDLAHGVKVFNLFEFRPVQVAYTENHCTHPPMYQEVRKSLHELGLFEEIVQDGAVRPAKTGLWFSEAADVWDDYRGSFAAGKRCLYIAIRHQQLPLDMIVDGDDLKGLQTLYLTDLHVTRKGAAAITDWVKAGGTLFATAGAGLFDEFNQPNQALRALYGIEPGEVEVSETDAIRLEKQDLPFAKPLDSVGWKEGKGAVIGVRSRFSTKDGEVLAKFSDGSPAAVERAVGKGRVIYCGFLPGLSYFHTALAQRPVDRCSTDDAYCHFIPTKFDAGARDLIGRAGKAVARPVECSEPLVETSVIESKQGVVIPLINWSEGPIRVLNVVVDASVAGGRKPSLASGGAVEVAPAEDGRVRYLISLNVADALILR